MKNNSFLKRYLDEAPVFLAMERAIECRLISSLDLKRPILDLGCGDGLFDSIFFSESVELGIDISMSELTEAYKKKAFRNIVNADLSFLPVKSKKFNTIICNSVLEHVDGFQKAISEAQRVLVSGGKFILTVPTENYEKFLFYSRLLEGLGLKNMAVSYQRMVNKIFRHHHAYPAEKWIRYVEQGGFKVIKAISYCPRKVMALSDFHLPFSFLSMFNKRMFRRWIFCPPLRKITAWCLVLYLRKSYVHGQTHNGACLLIDANCV